jgi:hypothetical protein
LLPKERETRGHNEDNLSTISGFPAPHLVL